MFSFRRKVIILITFCLYFLMILIEFINTGPDCEKAHSKKIQFYENLEQKNVSSEKEREMQQRILYIRNVCQQIENPNKKSQSCTLFESWDKTRNQKIKKHFIQDPNTGTIYCFLHKVI